jgi:hypothetical protein
MEAWTPASWKALRAELDAIPVGIARRAWREMVNAHPEWPPTPRQIGEALALEHQRWLIDMRVAMEEQQATDPATRRRADRKLELIEKVLEVSPV